MSHDERPILSVVRHEPGATWQIDAGRVRCEDCGAECVVAPTSLGVIAAEPAIRILCGECFVVTEEMVISALTQSGDEYVWAGDHEANKQP